MIKPMSSIVWCTLWTVYFNFINGLQGQNGQGIQSALNFGNSNLESGEACIWRKGGDRDPCPDPDVKYSLFTIGEDGKRHEEPVDLTYPTWIHSSKHDFSKETVVLIHGYAGVTDEYPMGVLRDAYLTDGKYNVYQVDWGTLTRIPCYAASVHNMRPVAKCVAGFLTFLRDSGVRVSTTTCVGHSLGAHICGIASNYLLFRMHKIIGLDPARPLIRSQLKGRLDAGDADIVQAIHTSSTFGDPRPSGHVDFCINGAKVQPFCVNTSNEALCSHIRSVCYLAESLEDGHLRMGSPCLRGRCSSTPRPAWDWMDREPVPMGHSTPDRAEGVYCISNEEAPYCPTPEKPKGNPLCCVPPRKANLF